MDQRLAAMKQRAQALAQEEGVETPNERHLPAQTASQRRKMSLDEVPSWEELSRQADQAVRGDVSVEDMLTAGEIRLAEAEVQRINDEFARRTGLDSRDMAFLATATSIQMARWMMMPKLIGAIGRTARLLALLSPQTMALLEKRQAAGSNVALVDEVNKEFQEEADWDAEVISEGHKSWEQILEDGAAATANGHERAFDNDALNWLFGIINNITGTKTLSDFSTVDAVTGETIKTPGIFADAFRSIKEDWLRLPAAVYAQYAKDRAAAGQDTDLLEPLADTFSPEMLSDLYTTQFAQLTAIQDLTLVGQQAAVPLVINMAVGLLHGFMYNPAKDGPREYYDARTRKILIYSNALATASNLAVTAGSENWAKLDVGGLIVSGLRIAQDASYIANLKDKFVKQQMDKVIEKELQDVDSYFLNLPAIH